MSTLTLTGAGPTSGVAAFDPVSLSPLVYLKADALVLNDGDAVGTWADSSGNGRDATQATAGKKPVYHLASGLAYVTHDAVDDGLVIGSLTLSTPYTVGMVVRGVTVGSARRMLQGTSANWLMATNRGGASLRELHYANGWVASSATAVPAAGAWHQLIVTNSGSASKAWLDGTDVTTGGTNVGTPGGLATGASGQSTGEPAGADFGDVIAVGSVLSTGDRQSLEAFWRTKYGTP